MSDRISQFSMSHDIVEDRLVLSVTTRERQQIELWLTRRFVQTVWPMLTRVLASDPSVATVADSVSRESVLAFQHEAATAHLEFDSDERPTTPSGATDGNANGQAPLLINAARISVGADAAVSLSLNAPDETGLTLSFNMRMLHSLCRLLRETIEIAEWQLDLSVGQLVDAPLASGRLN